MLIRKNFYRMQSKQNARNQDPLERAKRVLAEALLKGKIRGCLNLVDRGFFPIDEPTTDSGSNMLMYAAANYNAATIGELLARNPEYNSKDKFGRTALHYACRAGNLETFQLLVSLPEIEINAMTNAGVTPLMMAVQSGKIEVVAAALNNSLNPFPKDALGNDALHYSR